VEGPPAWSIVKRISGKRNGFLNSSYRAQHG